MLREEEKHTVEFIKKQTVLPTQVWHICGLKRKSMFVHATTVVEEAHIRRSMTGTGLYQARSLMEGVHADLL